MFNFYFFVVDVDYFSMFESKGKIILMLVGKLVSNCNSVRIVLEAQILTALRSVCTRLMRAELVTILKKKAILVYLSVLTHYSPAVSLNT